MPQVKVFRGANEEAINTWLSENPGIKILKMQVAIAGCLRLRMGQRAQSAKRELVVFLYEEPQKPRVRSI
jgi:hypothetical protein